VNVILSLVQYVEELKPYVILWSETGLGRYVIILFGNMFMLEQHNDRLLKSLHRKTKVGCGHFIVDHRINFVDLQNRLVRAQNIERP
jgi:hypothetical protein